MKVKDQGVGIAKKELSKIFKPYRNRSSVSKLNPSGIGLGLSICKRLCEGLDGRIYVKSTQHHGSTFVFTVKCRKEINSMEEDTMTSESLSSSDKSMKLYRERKEKLKVLVDKKFKEDLDMDVIEETEESHLSSARPRHQEEATSDLHLNSIADVRPLDTDGSNTDHNDPQAAGDGHRRRSITYDFYNLKSGNRRLKVNVQDASDSNGSSEFQTSQFDS